MPRVRETARCRLKIDAATVRALLTPAMVLDYYDVRRHGHAQWSVKLCPGCGQLSRGSVSIHPSTGLWRCHHCQAQGGIFDLVAGYAGVDIKTNFHQVLGLAAVIAGVPHDGIPEEEHVALLEAHRVRRAESAAREERKRQRNRAQMPILWNNLERRSVRGEAYLAGRALDPEVLRARDSVRYSATHDPAVALRDLATGAVVGIQYRKLTGDAKLLSQPGSQVQGSCFIGCLAHFERTRLAILVEGLADSLAARLTWPTAVIFGAPGASQLAVVAAAIAPHVAARRGLLLVVPDDDPPGEHNTALAIIAAQKAGLELVDQAHQVHEEDEAKIQLVDLGHDLADRPHHDLAQARACSRWGWQWPARATRPARAEAGPP